ncbi:MAG: tRNA (adenosine(37)-N6)-threonylcarbamoyltransferase complex transferase subunit TsaD [bacterium]|nr:tRNA (adenosine(37)-N6)-threonylcarbamoyltransferase complex transferase subunit TsaD [bacterium]
MIILGIETSCDDTSAGIYCTRRKVMASVLATQIEHRAFGGVVPELASRVHLKNLPPVLRATLEDAELELSDIDAVAVTHGPGLLGSLLVGLAFARSLTKAWDKPLVGVHHIESHIMANNLERDMVFPAMALVVSGGHSQIILIREPGRYELLATTRDDAAGEAFDKVAKMLGLGYPGGPVVEKLAREGDPDALRLPIARLGDGSLDYSFSGLKTAARLAWEARSAVSDCELRDFCASLQKAIIGQLLERVKRAVRGRDIKAFYLAGGVAANRALLEAASNLLEPLGIPVFAPSPRYCTDNGIMVACAAANHLRDDREPPPIAEAFSRGNLASWR